jgi:hypothetical protein
LDVADRVLVAPVFVSPVFVRERERLRAAGRTP